MKKFIPFTVKAASDGYMYIEGVANKAVVDRGNDMIDPKAWDLKNYVKNPVLLYNHDRDKIIGRAVDIKPQEDGLHVKARISKSRDSMVSYVRDMIEEGMINAFSVGFSAKDSEKTKDGVNTIKAAELYEVSVVSIPMNQESLFAVTMKDLAAAGSLKNIRRKFLEAKAASEPVLQLQDTLDAMENLGAVREECILALCEACGLTRDELRDILAGDADGVPEAVTTEAQRMLEDLRANDGNDESPEAKAKPSEDGPDMDPDGDDEDEKPAKPKKYKKPEDKVDAEDEEKLASSVATKAPEMTVQTDIQAIMTQNNVLMAALIGEVQKLNALMTQYLAAEEVEAEAEEKPEEEKPGEEAVEASPSTAPESEVAPSDAGGKTSSEEDAATKLLELKLAEIKATLEKVKKTARK
jgi:HK97 family phage prohead protease